MSVIPIDTQVHGYKQGHQLLSASSPLPKGDQSVVDRLSDVAGPLRPNERFNPYLSTYPLPSGTRYVVAKTWQDLTVPRAGCVRTLSLLVPIELWAETPGLNSIFAALDAEDFPTSAHEIIIGNTSPAPLPATPPFRASELLEALFLEDPKPVALFDAPAPELIATRLLTALWPSLRKRFALSTFALSPRKLEGRSFDLVFAPKDARSRFTDWEGRRIDAQAGEGARHRWTGAIVDRVFRSPLPRLLNDRELAVVGEGESFSTSTLRIALLWDELLGKLERSPSAVLGLLDITNSRPRVSNELTSQLRPALASAAHRAVISLPASEAWDLIGAMTRKLHGSALASSLPDVAEAAGILAGRAPAGAVALLDQDDPQRAIDVIVPSVAEGLNTNFGPAVEGALDGARPDTLARLIEANTKLAETAVATPALLDRIAEALEELLPSRSNVFREAILPYLVSETHADVALRIIETLSPTALISHVKRLERANRFEAAAFYDPINQRAARLGVTSQLRDFLVEATASQGRDDFLLATLVKNQTDLRWLLENKRLKPALVARLVVNLLRGANSGQLRSMLRDRVLAKQVLERVPDSEIEILLRIVNDNELALDIRVGTLFRLLDVDGEALHTEITADLLHRCLSEHFEGDEPTVIARVLEAAGEKYVGRSTVEQGLKKRLQNSLIDRNLIAFNSTSKATRGRIVASVEDIATSLAERYNLELDATAMEACGLLFWDARTGHFDALLRASGRLLPTLLRSKRSPVSSLIASTFPLIYQELAKKDDVPDLLKFVPLLDWDRCKAARRELVDAFMSSPSWTPSDLALTACRAKDVERILRRVGKSYRGDEYIDRLSNDLSNLPPSCRMIISDTIEAVRSDRSAKYSWRD